jgi:hypothetical protein
MSHKPVLFTAIVALLGFGMTPLFASQMPGMQMSTASQTDKSQKSLDAEMMSHQKEMQTLLVKLQASFQAIVNASDSNGYVRDKSIVKAHEADITAFRNAVRNHKLFLIDYERECGVNRKQHDAMIQHQEHMKSILYDLGDTFAAYEDANNTSIDQQPNPVEYAMKAHRQAITELKDAIAQHNQAMTQMIKTCSAKSHE